MLIKKFTVVAKRKESFSVALPVDARIVAVRAEHPRTSLYALVSGVSPEGEVRSFVVTMKDTEIPAAERVEFVVSGRTDYGDSIFLVELIHPVKVPEVAPFSASVLKKSPAPSVDDEEETPEEEE